jgi:hypothetical protein
MTLSARTALRPMKRPESSRQRGRARNEGRILQARVVTMLLKSRRQDVSGCGEGRIRRVVRGE